MIIGKEDIKKHIPHREPFLFVDSVVSRGAGALEASLFLSPGLPFFKGHFPGRAIMPGVLIVEALAQASGLLLSLDAAEKGREPCGAKIFYLASNSVKFTHTARPGDTLLLRSRLVKSFGTLTQFSVEAVCGNSVAASGNLVLAEAE